MSVTYEELLEVITLESSSRQPQSFSEAAAKAVLALIEKKRESAPVFGPRQQDLIAHILQEALETSVTARQPRRHIKRAVAAMLLIDDPTFDRKRFIDSIRLEERAQEPDGLPPMPEFGLSSSSWDGGHNAWSEGIHQLVKALREREASR